MSKKIFSLLAAALAPLFLILISSAVLAGSMQTPAAALAAGMHAPAAGPQQIYLPVVVRAISQTSRQKIQAAVQSGAISAETGLEYEVFSDYQDKRLPPEFISDPNALDSEGLDSEEILSQFAALSPGAQAVLQPFLLPAYEPDSWLYLPSHSSAMIRGSSALTSTLVWSSKVVVGPRNIKIWWHKPEYAALADEIAAGVLSIWNGEVTIMNTLPITDGLQPRGRGPEFDILIEDLDPYVSGKFVAYSDFSPGLFFRSPRHAGFIYINGLHHGLNLQEVIAHELFHAFQAAYDVKDAWESYSWWREATATWYDAFLYPTSGFFAPYAKVFMDNPGLALDFDAPIPSITNPDSHKYGAFLFPLYVTNRNPASLQPDFVRKTFALMKTESVFQAIDDNLPGGFTTTWPQFVQYLWNQPPLDFFKQKFQIADSVKTTDGGYLVQISPNSVFPNPVDLDRLSFKFYHYYLADPGFHTLAVVNSIYSTTHGTLQAWLKINGIWTYRDLSQEQNVTYCLDLHAERVSELLIITSNSDFTPGAAHLVKSDPVELHLTNIGCYAYALHMTVTEEQKGVIWNWTTKSVYTGTVYAYPPLNADYSLDFYGASLDAIAYQAHTHSAWHNSLVGIDYTCQGDYLFSGKYAARLQILDAYNLNQKNLGSSDRQYGVESRVYPLPQGNLQTVDETCQPSQPLYMDRSVYQYRPVFDLFTHPIEGFVYELIDDNGSINYQNSFSGYNFYFASSGDMTIYNTTYTFTPFQEP